MLAWRPVKSRSFCWQLTLYFLSVCVCESLSHVQLFVTLGLQPHQAPLSVGFSREEHWSGWPFPSPGDLPDSGIGPRSHTVGRFFTIWATGEALPYHNKCYFQLNSRIRCFEVAVLRRTAPPYPLFGSRDKHLSSSGERWGCPQRYTQQCSYSADNF